MRPLSAAALRVLRRAASRPDGCVSIGSGLHGAVQTKVLAVLTDLGLITNEPAPRITEEGRKAAMP